MYELTSVMRLDQTIIQSCQRFIKLCGLQSMANAAVVIWSESPGRNAERETNELKQAERNLHRMATYSGSNSYSEKGASLLPCFGDVALSCR